MNVTELPQRPSRRRRGSVQADPESQSAAGQKALEFKPPAETRGGVAPAELEDLLLGHPKVEDVAVMGVPDEYSGELPKAYITLKPDVEECAAVGKEIIAYVKDKKVRHKWVNQVEFVSVIIRPDTSSASADIV